VHLLRLGLGKGAPAGMWLVESDTAGALSDPSGTKLPGSSHVGRSDGSSGRRMHYSMASEVALGHVPRGSASTLPSPCLRSDLGLLRRRTCVDQEERGRRRVLREAEAAEGRDRRSREHMERWRRDGMSISWEEYAADPGIVCRGCGLTLDDRSGGWPLPVHMDADHRAAFEAAEAAWRERHATCREGRWSISGSRTYHCSGCCPPPPMSPEQRERIRAIFAGARDVSSLDVWRLTLSCGHTIEWTAHRDHDQLSRSVHDCSECGQRRANVSAERLGPADVPPEDRVDARQARALESAQTELRRAEARLAKAQERLASMQGLSSS
jgi:hypothetical protein